MKSLSVVMPVHNAMPYLDAAISSIVDQTHRDFEFVVFDDGSTDGSPEAIRRWTRRDSRILAVRSDRQLGLVGSSRGAVDASSGDIVARMDADDIAAPERLGVQLDVFRRRPKTVLVGCLSSGIDASGVRVRPPDLSRLFGRAPVSPPFPHGSAMFARAAYDRIGGYRAEAEGWEDVDLFLRLASIGDVYVVPQALYLYRYMTTTSIGGASRADRAHALASLQRHVGGGAVGPDVFRDIVPPDRRDLKKVGAGAYVSRTALAVWAGERAREKPGFDLPLSRSTMGTNAKALIYATAGRIAPRILRTLLRWSIERRNARLSRTLDLEREIPWRVGS